MQLKPGAKVIEEDLNFDLHGYILYVSSASQACNANNNGNANGENGVSNANYVAGISLSPSH